MSSHPNSNPPPICLAGMQLISRTLYLAQGMLPPTPSTSNPAPMVSMKKNRQDLTLTTGVSPGLRDCHPRKTLLQYGALCPPQHQHTLFISFRKQMSLSTVTREEEVRECECECNCCQYQVPYKFMETVCRRSNKQKL